LFYFCFLFCSSCNLVRKNSHVQSLQPGDQSHNLLLTHHQQHKSVPYIVHPAHFYNNQKSPEIVQSIEKPFSGVHPPASQAIYANAISAYHHNSGGPLAKPGSTNNAIYVNTANIIPTSGTLPNNTIQHTHYGTNHPQRHPGSAGHVPYSPAMLGYHSHPPPQSLTTSDNLANKPAASQLQGTTVRHPPVENSALSSSTNHQKLHIGKIKMFCTMF